MLMLQANEVFKVGKPFLWFFNGCLRKQNIPEPRYIDFTNKGITSPGVCCNPAVISGPTSISFLSQLILFLRPCQKRLVSLSLSVTLRYTVVIQLSIYNIYTMYMPCICHVYAMYMPCIPYDSYDHSMYTGEIHSIPNHWDHKWVTSVVIPIMPAAVTGDNLSSGKKPFWILLVDHSLGLYYPKYWGTS